MSLSSGDIVNFVTGYAVEGDARAAAVPAILDTLAVLAAGSTEPVTLRLATSLSALQDPSANPSFQNGQRYRSDDAALLYGTAAHALDFDDVSMLAICHPSAPVLAALLAAGPWDRLTGPEMCEAHAIGTEVMIRMGQAIRFRHYELGFHSTATLGVFGATAAVARLVRLDPDTTANALAIAASLASGLRLNFGSMVKPLHVGIAAANAIRAIAWAKAGIEASRGDLFVPGGVLAAFSGGAQVEWPDAVGLGSPFAIQAPGFERKRYPCCYLLHKIIALGLEAGRDGIRLDDVAHFRVVMPNGGTSPLTHPCPSSGSEAQFSGPYALLASINDGEINFSSFTDIAVARQSLRARYPDVAIAEVGDTSLDAEQIGAATVTLELKLTDGSSRRYARDAAPGSPGDPMTPSELRAKWIDCFGRVRPDLQTVEAAAFHDNGVAVLASGQLGGWLNSVWRELGVAGTQQDRTKAK